MKMVTALFNSVIDFEEGFINSIILENSGLFNRLITNFVNQINGEEGLIVLSDDNREMKIANSTELISTFIPFEINSKKLLTKIASIIEKEAVNEQYYARTEELLTNIELYIDELAAVLPCELIYETITPASLVRMAGLKICNDSMSELENIFDYMNLVRELDRDKLFVFVNMRSYYEDVEMQNFIDTVVAHKFRVLLVESHCKSLLRCEKRLVIDNDLCEF